MPKSLRPTNASVRPNEGRKKTRSWPRDDGVTSEAGCALRVDGRLRRGPLTDWLQSDILPCAPEVSEAYILLLPRRPITNVLPAGSFGRVTFGHGIGEAHHDADRNCVRK